MTNAKYKKNNLSKVQRKKLNRARMKLEVERDIIKNLKVNLRKNRLKNIKSFGVRNLKIVASVGRFTIPYVLAGTIAVGGVKLLGGGWPIVYDDVVEQKEFYVDYKTDEYFELVTAYNLNKSYDNNLLIKTPWIMNEDGMYERFERQYVIDDDTVQLIYEAILDEDFETILQSIKVKEEKKITSSCMDVDSDKNYFYVDAHIKGLFENDFIIVEESFDSNFWMSALDAILIFVLSYLAHKIVKYDVKERIKNINREYKSAVVLNGDLLKKIANHEEKALILRKEISSYGKKR